MGNNIILAGIPGSGKTTLARLLGKLGGFAVHLEDHTQNRYHADFVQDKRTWAFHNEVDFLLGAYEVQKYNSASPVTSCQDGSIYQYFHVYIQYLFKTSVLNQRDLETLQRLFWVLETNVPPPSLMVVLEASPYICFTRIEKRSRKFDNVLKTDIKFLEEMNRLLELWLSEWKKSPLLYIDTTKLNLIQDKHSQTQVLNEIAQHLKTL